MYYKARLGQMLLLVPGGCSVLGKAAGTRCFYSLFLYTTLASLFITRRTFLLWRYLLYVSQVSTDSDRGSDAKGSTIGSRLLCVHYLISKSI
jgi:hypothetical protein